MEEAIELEADFAVAMQVLSAQAADSAAVRKEEVSAATDISILISAVHSLGQRIEALEESVFRKIEAIHFEKIESQLSAIRDSETVNQQLFDSLHKELISYRDNFVRDALQKPFIRDLLVLFDDLNAIAQRSRHDSGKGEKGAAKAHLSDNLDNAIHFLLEILHRLEVTEIAVQEKIDRTLHRVLSFEEAETAEEDGQIVRRMKRGFIWQDRVLRPEEVIAKRFK